MMKNSQWVNLIQRVIQSAFSMKKQISCTSMRTRNSSRIHSKACSQVTVLESLESRMLLAGTSVDSEPVLHVLPVATEQPVEDASAEEGLTVNAPLSDTFSLNSNINALHTIYLDFTGHTTSGTYWNYGKSANLVTDVFSLDGDSAFSDTELQRIQNIWQRVAEDFMPFNVNVTTAEPPLSDLIKSNSSDTRWGVRVAIGGSYQDWYGNSSGGVAYLNSFNWTTDTPTFVFAETLYNDEKYVAEAISHEAGHTLNLSHDGTSSQGYYTGHGSGATGWAPIMGVGYYRELTQWSKGEYTGASQTQDDLYIITTNNGFGYRVDDYGNSLADATALTLGQSNTITSQEGIIEQNTDTDWFSFTTTGGAINLSFDPFVRGPNLDILAELYNESGQLILTSNPSTLLDATLSTNLAAGTYYVKIDGIGKGDLTTGYSDYGSLGQYTISGIIEGFSTGNSKLSFGAWDSTSGLYFSDTSNLTSTTTATVPSYGPNGQGQTFTGDFDGDGVDELAVRDSAGNWWIGENVSGVFQFSQWGKWGSPSSIQNTIVGDFNGDGKDDIAGLYNNGSWWIAVSSGSSFVNQKWSAWGNAAAIQETFVGDFDGDGKDDIAGMYSNGHWWVGISTGNSFSNQRWARWSGSNVKEAVVADFNNDGRDDIAVLYNNGSWWVGASNGNAFTAKKWAVWGSTSQIEVIRTGDFNGDGKDDIAGLWQNGIWWVAVSDGNEFTNQKWGQWGSISKLDQVLAGDFNGDGKDDLIGLYDSGAWWMAESQGNSFQNTALTKWINISSESSFFSGNFDSVAASPEVITIPGDSTESPGDPTGSPGESLAVSPHFLGLLALGANSSGHSNAIRPGETGPAGLTRDVQLRDLVERWRQIEQTTTQATSNKDNKSANQRNANHKSSKAADSQPSSQELVDFLETMDQQLLDESLHQLS